MGRLGCDADGNLNDEEFSKPMPWIGIYVAAASLICGVAMVADLIHGSRHRKFWFPCRFFTLNATSLTFIAVAIKLSVDLNSSMPRSQDQLTKLSSSVFICTVMGNSMPSLGIMTNQDLIMNIMALGILVVTLIVNICMQLGTGAIYVFWKEHAFVMFLMLVMLMIMSFSALVIPTTKQYLELKYKKKYELALKKCPCEKERTGIMRLKEDLMMFWMMAHTCSPEFVIGRSVTCAALGFLCLLSALTLVEAILQSYLIHDSLGFCRGDCDYKWSTTLVLVIQTSAVGLGTIAPAIRWFTAIIFRCPKRGNGSCGNGFNVESYWTQSLIDRKECPLSVRIKSQRCRKFAHDAKRMFLDLCVGIQCGIVLVSKVICFVSVYFVSRLLVCCDFCKRLKRFGTTSSITNNESWSESKPSKKLDLARFVLHLEGEAGLVDVMIRRNCEATDHWIRMGKREEPKHLIELLETTAPLSRGFQGIKDFDSDLIPSLDTEEPPNCWALPLATLTSIAMALPNIKLSLLNKLLSCVNEGFFYVKQVEDILDIGGELVHIRKAAGVVWLGVDLYHKWLDLDLHKLSVEGKSLEETLKEIADTAKKTYFKSKQENIIACLKQSPSKWPLKVIAANSMYRICETILMKYKTGRYQTSEELFKAIQLMISDVISGCLSNIPRVISIKCLVTAVEARQESVRGAAFHLGRAEKILEIVDKKYIPELTPDQIARIDGWRSFFKLNDTQSCTPSSCENETVSPATNELRLSVE